MNKIKYLRSDWKRLYKSYEFYAAIIGVAISLFFSLENQSISEYGVLCTYMESVSLSGYVIAFAFCAFPYAAVFCQDLENKYIRYQMIRGDLKRYVLSKIIVIYISSVVVMILGTILFLMICRTRAPWIDDQVDDFALFLNTNFGFLIQEKHYMFYCILYSLHLGLLAGLFSVFSAFCSLYISNKVTVWILPIVVYQIWLEYRNYPWVDTLMVLPDRMDLWKDWNCLFMAVVISLIPTTLLAAGTIKKIKTRF